MKNLKTLERLQHLHLRIKNENTGSPKDLAALMQISQRSVHLLMDKLKDYSAEICYSRNKKTYYYANDFDLQVAISVTILNGDEITEVFGGSYFLKQNLFVARKLQ